MKQRLFKSLLILSGLGIFLVLALCLWVSYRQATVAGYASLRDEARLVATALDKQVTEENLNRLELKDRLTLIDATGSVLYDSYASAASMGNHLDRPEVKEALLSGEGRSQRPSATLGKNIIYLAVRLDDGRVLRLARTNDALYSELNVLLGNLLLLGLALFFGANFAAKKITARALRPLEELDLEQADPDKVYPELKPVVERFSAQELKLAKGISRYKAKKQELKALTNNMDEGMLFLEPGWIVASMNKSAIRFFGRDKQELLKKSFLELDPSEDIRLLLQELEQYGKARTVINRGSSYYQLNGSRISAKGYMLLIMDVTERTVSEKLRREFSANVSHELKTPLQSVLGYSEIMLSGLVKEEDGPRFLRKIYDEAQKLLYLIDDIIKLSRLDELKRDMLEEFNLKQTVESAFSRLRDKASQAGIEMQLEDATEEPCVLLGIASLMEEVFFNLIDNSIKYNHTGGSVKVRLSESSSRYVVSVTDTGIGIAADQLPHIFERFYRIDRSRSKEIEGTGLGLSIVKHGVMFHKGTVKVFSTLGQGTEFVLKFPKGQVNT